MTTTFVKNKFENVNIFRNLSRFGPLNININLEVVKLICVIL